MREILEILKWLSFFILIVSRQACNPISTESQSIRIDIYGNGEKNAYLAKELLFYDLKYLIHKIPSLTTEVARGVKLGFYVDSSNNTYYKVTYLLRNNAVKSNLEVLKKDFADFIPTLARQHANNEQLFADTNKIGTVLIDHMFSNKVESVWDNSSAELQNASSLEKFKTFLDKWDTEFGANKSIEFLYAQYYEEFGEVPEHVSLIYRLKFERRDDVKALINLSKENDRWKLVGFNFF